MDRQEIMSKPMKTNYILEGDCLEKLKELPDNSIDSVVTDPPYELGFMGKSWDSTGIAFNVAVWQECLRVLKPGGHLLAFSGSRTYHRMAVAIEDAGFEIRDQIMWVYGSGFPKSLNISKAIDKAAGAKREVVGGVADRREDGTTYALGHSGNLTSDQAITAAAKQWQGWGTALKPAHEPIVMARKPITASTIAENVLEYGTGAINIDGSRVGTQGVTSKVDVETKERTGNEQVYGVYNNVAFGVPVENLGRFPANFIHDGSDEVVDLFPNTKASKSALRGLQHSGRHGGLSDLGGNLNEDSNTVRGHTDNGGSAARFFYCAKASKSDRNEGLVGFEEKQVVTFATANGTSGKPSSISEGRDTKNRNYHPTVKPTELMKYLINLVTPKGGIVLDPFLGSGSTAKAAELLGVKWIGCELTPEYIPIIKARVAHAKKEYKKAKQQLELDLGE